MRRLPGPSILRFCFRFGLLAALLVAGGCATAHAPAGEDQRQVYAADLNTVAQAAGEAFVDAGLTIEDSRWERGTTFVIDGYRESAFLRSRGQGVREAAVRVEILRVGERQTEVRVVTSEDALPAAASSADRRTDYARRFFDRLDDRLRP